MYIIEFKLVLFHDCLNCRMRFLVAKTYFASDAFTPGSKPLFLSSHRLTEEPYLHFATFPSRDRYALI